MVCSVILAGGSGTRLWPLSSKKTPKQFLTLFGSNSMIVDTGKRVGDIVGEEDTYILTGEKYKNLVSEQFGNKVNVMAEPMAKNTAPCILWACLKIAKDKGGDSVLAVMPSDHLIAEQYNFSNAFKLACDGAMQGKIVTFGIVPTRAETGYGYIEIEDNSYEANKTIKKLCAFHEKPSREKAEEYISTGKYLWNSGMFVFRADTMIEEFKKYAPEVYGAFEGKNVDDEKDVYAAFNETQSISIDYAIMEKTAIASCIPSSFGWSDVGSYKSLHDENTCDENNNVIKGENIITEETSGCYIYGDKKIVCVGLKNVVVVQKGDTILVSDMGMSENIGKIAKKIEE